MIQLHHLKYSDNLEWNGLLDEIVIAETDQCTKVSSCIQLSGVQCVSDVRGQCRGGQDTVQCIEN